MERTNKVFSSKYPEGRDLNPLDDLDDPEDYVPSMERAWEQRRKEEADADQNK